MIISLDFWLDIISGLATGIAFHALGVQLGFAEGRRPGFLIFGLIAWIGFMFYAGQVVAWVLGGQILGDPPVEAAEWVVFTVMMAIGVTLDHRRHRS